MPTPTKSVQTRADSRLAPLAAAVRRRRGELGLRQAALADLAGCSERFVYSLEHGKGTVHLSKVLDVLEVLGLGLTLGPGHGGVVAPDGDRGP